jgi:hypothetical protein
MLICAVFTGVDILSMNRAKGPERNCYLTIIRKPF